MSNSDDLKTWEDCVEAFVQCDHKYCPNLDEIRSKGVLLVSAEVYPKEFTSFIKCSERFAGNEKASEEKCGPMIDTILESAAPIFDNATAQYRTFQPDNLKNYDPENYRSPFWFSPLGALWKRQRHNSDITPLTCLPIEHAAEHCVSDASLNNSDCMKIRQMAYLCRAGVACVDTQDELRKCYEEFRGTGNRSAPHSAAFLDCAGKVKKFQQCAGSN